MKQPSDFLVMFMSWSVVFLYVRLVYVKIRLNDGWLSIMPSFIIGVMFLGFAVGRTALALGHLTLTEVRDLFGYLTYPFYASQLYLAHRAHHLAVERSDFRKGAARMKFEARSWGEE